MGESGSAVSSIFRRWGGMALGTSCTSEANDKDGFESGIRLVRNGRVELVYEPGLVKCELRSSSGVSLSVPVHNLFSM